MPVDLSRTSVFLDWDGTITLVDTGVHLLDRLAPASWRDIEAEYKSGAIGSRECLSRQWELLPKDEQLLREVAGEVPLDESFLSLADGLRSEGAEVTVVSDGYGFYAEKACRDAGLALLTNTVDFTTGVLDFPHLDACCACSSCGTCKQAPIRDAARRGQTTIFVGDGMSDRKAALLADVLFAKANLADWCDDVGQPFRRFSNLADVQRSLGL
jgi:2-hydroxy-3-keto-5-methylthiopentenyl-1-phosphate phosphatase